MIKKLGALILSLCLVSGAVVNADEVAVTEPVRDILIGTVQSQTLTVPEGETAPTRIFSMTVADVGDVKMMYFASNASTGPRLYAYKVNSDGTYTYVDDSGQITNLKSEWGIAVKGNYLIYIDNSYVKFRKINSDGSLAESDAYTINAINNTSKGSIELIDDFLFVNCNANGVRVYNVATDEDGEFENTNFPMTQVVASSDCSSGVAAVTADKVSDIRYRVYTVLRGGNMNITDVVNGMESVTVENQYATAALAAEDGLTVSRTIGSTWGYMSVVSENTLVFYEINNPPNDYVIDVSTATSPKITDYIAHANNQTAYQYKVRLDRTRAISLSKNNTTTSKLVDYATGQEATVSGISGEGASVYDNVIYSAKNDVVFSVEFFKAYDVSAPVVTPSETMVTATVNIDNYLSKEFKSVLFVAVYKDDKMFDCDIVPNVTAGFEEGDAVTAEVDVTGLTDYAIKAWVIDDFGNMNLLSEVTE